MKTKIAIFMVLIISLSVLGSKYSFGQQEEKTTIATFKSVTDDDTYKFIDAKNKIIYFDLIDENIEIDLYDEINIGKKFSITWKEEVLDVYDDDGEPTGKTEIFKTITELKKM